MSVIKFLEKQGIKKEMILGFIGLTLFMVGDGMESGFLSPFLRNKGFSEVNVIQLWTVYGLIVAFAAWLSGALSEVIGPKKVILIGATIWIVFEILFLYFGIFLHNFNLMLITFGFRALGYPMFAYGFLVWLTLVTDARHMGKIVGWYWFFSTLGLGVISSFVAGIIIPKIGMLLTLWSSLLFVAAGTFIALWGTRHQEDVKLVKLSLIGNIIKTFKSLTIVVEQPKIGFGGIVRIINTVSYYAFVVFFTTYMLNDIKIEVATWQQIWGTMLTANIIGNLLAGYLGDIFGHRKIVMWFGGLLTFFTSLGMYYIPTYYGDHISLIFAINILYGISLAMYVPLSALIPLLAQARKASAVSILNLGAGLSQFFGPVLAGLVPVIGIEKTVWVIALWYLVGIFFTIPLKLDKTPTGNNSDHCNKNKKIITKQQTAEA